MGLGITWVAIQIWPLAYPMLGLGLCGAKSAKDSSHTEPSLRRQSSARCGSGPLLTIRAPTRCRRAAARARALLPPRSSLPPGRWRRDETAARCDDPAVAPAHNRLDATDPRYPITARNGPHAGGPLQGRLPTNDIQNHPTFDGCRLCFREWHRPGRRLRGWGRHGLRGLGSTRR
jgi:hypothetical protein